MKIIAQPTIQGLAKVPQSKPIIAVKRIFQSFFQGMAIKLLSHRQVACILCTGLLLASNVTAALAIEANNTATISPNDVNSGKECWGYHEIMSIVYLSLVLTIALVAAGWFCIYKLSVKLY